MTPRFRKAHYQTIAELHKDARKLEQEYGNTDGLSIFMDMLIGYFKGDNPQFDEARFRDAAGLAEHHLKVPKASFSPSGR